MCYMCEENNGEMEGCQDCGSMICFDIRRGGGDDVMSRAYVTNEGDLMCERCGSRYDRAAEKWDDVEGDEYDGWDNYPEDWYDAKSPVSEIEPPETPRMKYIGPGSETTP